MKYIVLFLALTVAAIAADVTLPSGRVIKVIQIGQMTFTSGLPSAWVIQYETVHPFTAKKEIITEVEDIWTTFRLEVEKRKMKMGIIKVAGPISGLIIKERTEINFVFEPKSDGTWSMQLPDLMKEEKK
jgi:hypothetical protein